MNIKSIICFNIYLIYERLIDLCLKQQIISIKLCIFFIKIYLEFNQEFNHYRIMSKALFIHS